MKSAYSESMGETVPEDEEVLRWRQRALSADVKELTERLEAVRAMIEAGLTHLVENDRALIIEELATTLRTADQSLKNCQRKLAEAEQHLRDRATASIKRPEGD